MPVDFFGEEPQVPQKPNFFSGIAEGIGESAKAASMMLGVYEPESPEEAQMLRRRFMADAAGLVAGGAASALTGGMGAGLAPIARMILSGAAGGAVGGGVQSGMMGQNPAVGAAVGGAVGGAFGAIPGMGRVGSASRAAQAAEAAASTKAGNIAAADRWIGAVRGAGKESPLEAVHVQAPADAPPTLAEEVMGGTARLPGNTGVRGLEEATTLNRLRQPPKPDPVYGEYRPAWSGARYPYATALEGDIIPVNPVTRLPGDDMPVGPPRRSFNVEPQPRVRVDIGDVVGGGSTTEFRRTAPTIDFGATMVGPAGPPTAVRILAQAGGKSRKTKEAVSAALTEFRQHVRDVQGRAPRGARFRVRRPQPGRKVGVEGYQSEVAALNPASEMESVNAGLRGMLRKLPEGEAFGRVWGDIQTIYRRGVRLAGTAVRKMGPVGQRMAADMDDVINRSQRVASEDALAIKRITHKMSTSDAVHLGDVLNGDAVPRTAELADAAMRLRALLDRIAESASRVGLREMSWRTGKVRPFTYMENYFPHTFDPKVVRKYLEKGSAEQQRAVQKILSMNLAKTPDEALDMLKRFLLTPPEFRYGHLQFARDLALPDFERDIRKVLPGYVVRAHKRIETARTFGPSDQIAAKMIRELGDQGQDWEIARDIYMAFADRMPRDMQDLINATRTFNIVSLLSTAGIVQLAQHGNTIAYLGFKNYMRGLGSYLTKEGREWAPKTGAYLQELIGELSPEDVAGGLLNPQNLIKTVTGPHRAANWLQFIGLTPLDKANRMIAALAGRSHADQVAMKFVRASAAGNAKEVAKHSRELIRLQLTPEEVLAAGGNLTDDMHLRAGQAASHITQFRGSVLDMPAWARTTVPGQFAYLFKTFAVQQFRFIRTLLDEARQGNPGPALKYLAATGTLTPMVGHAVRTARGRQQPDDPMWSYVEAALNAGAIGIAYDGLRAAASGPEFVLGFFTGPTAAQLAHLTSEVVRAGDRPEALMRDVLRHTPMVGPHLAEWLVPKER